MEMPLHTCKKKKKWRKMCCAGGRARAVDTFPKLETQTWPISSTASKADWAPFFWQVWSSITQGDGEGGQYSYFTPLHLLQYSFFSDYLHCSAFPQLSCFWIWDKLKDYRHNFLLNNILLLHANNTKILMQLLVNATAQKNAYDIE